MRFQIGDKVWVARFESMAPDYVTCPDCGGTGRLRVTFHDETQVSIECRNCSAGYDPPSGQVIVYRQKVTARLATITGVEINGPVTTWRTDDYYLHDDTSVFTDEATALEHGKHQQADYQREQRDKIATKEKDSRTWAWNASYHRGCIKRAQKDIEYHSAKLAVAAIKAKDKAA